MKALSVRQPWANLIVHGIKDVENRSRRTNFRGRILIHSPKIEDKEPNIISLPDRVRSLMSFIEENSTVDMSQVEYVNFLHKTWGPIWDVQHKSAVIGSVEIVDCIDDSSSVWSDFGSWHWILKDPILFDKPILGVKGNLGLWNYDLPEGYNA
ncbi:MAG: ASCH domain-containing protein [Spirochaetaceae bacterium]|jgi:hypothetical protein|nr:ASCH domain-containing protein [Spirochaetaceae bacterium]